MLSHVRFMKNFHVLILLDNAMAAQMSCSYTSYVSGSSSNGVVSVVSILDKLHAPRPSDWWNN